MTIRPGPRKWMWVCETAVPTLFAAACALILLASSVSGSSARLVPPNAQGSEGASTAGYCPSRGGITYWERIQDIKYHFDDPQLVLMVRGEILNPNGCGPDSCPDYDGSPEYINGWIDWNLDGRWDPSERVIDVEFSDYRSKSYRGNLPVEVRVPMPPVLIGAPVLRVTLGWGYDPDDPCNSAWAFGDVRDLPLTDAKWVISEIRVLGGNPIVEVPDGVIWRETCEEKYGIPAEKPKSRDEAVRPEPGKAIHQAPKPVVEERNATYQSTIPQSQSAGQTDESSNSEADTAGPTGESTPLATSTTEAPGPTRQFPPAIEGEGYTRVTAEPSESRPQEPERTTPNPAGGNLRFTGRADFEPLDADSDGLFDALVVEPEFVTSVEGGFAMNARLVKDGKAISISPAWETAIFTYDHFSGPPGTYTTRLWFSGESIFRSGEDGPYRVYVSAISGIGLEDTARINTPAYSHTRFGEIGATIVSVSDSGVDPDADGLFDVLRATVGVSVRAEGEYYIAADLSTGIRGGTHNSKTDHFAPGAHHIDIDFDGRAINESRKDGPWEIVVNLTDPEGGWLDSRRHQTQPYLVDDFKPAPIMLTGPFDDRAVDRDGNGLFDALRFTFGVKVNAESAATYDVTAWLGDSTGRGSAFDADGDKMLLAPGIQTLSINFDGSAIANRRQDGRYTVTAISIQNDKRNEVAFFEPDYLTKRYRYWDFDPWPPRFAYLDTLYSRLEDTDGDGLADYLVIAPLMKSSAAAHLMVSATLTDRHGRFIHEGTGATEIGRDEQAYIDIRFDGRRIFGSLEDGPYSIDHAHFYTHGSRLSGIDVSLGETEPYSYDQFEPAAVIVGVVEASPDTPAVLAEVRTTHSVDWTDSTGKYRLVFVGSDLDSLLVRTSHERAHGWDIYLNGEFLKTGDTVWMPIEIGRIDTLDFLAPRPR